MKGRNLKIDRLERRLQREILRRAEAESIAEARLRDLYEGLSRLKLLEHIAAASNQMQSVEQVLQFAVNQFSEFGHWRLGHAFVNIDNVLRTSGAWYAVDEMRTSIFRTVTRIREFVPGEGLPGIVLSTKKPLWIADLESAINFPRLRFALRSGLKSGVAFPILRRTEVVAVVELFDTAYRPPDNDLMELMAEGGEQLGMAIDRQNAKQRLELQTSELAAARDEAKAADKAKSAFLAGMSHELRTPLNAIIGFSDLMLAGVGGKLSDQQADYVEDIRNSGIQLKDIVNNILDLTKIDAGALIICIQAVSLAEICEECLRMLEPLATAGSIRLGCTIPEFLPAINLDSFRFKQALLNVVNNAIKFTPPGGQVQIVAGIVEREYVLSVCDNGIGMSHEEVILAGQSFRQVDGRLSRRFEGTGLGLPLAKALIELHGGKLSIDSMPGKGTTVRFHLPRSLEIIAA